ncbi:hypothetical protein CHLRE_10g460800v5 [Chlamydomonas reinhardtii]|uniref:Protein kinase domain-containing protein n=1 Tax=Chlamydomonas reinhardtii TaxID=3055 RepID=A0A2K3DBV5_CHLRE|nr:uncharacterized protein CHLRE_10g460800v5 [Chlamydomonas reinhardtii]PNW78011.1 hypothetical protein CHLRE_10g460800v5 [Chlamydomonas reinhardtii]
MSFRRCCSRRWRACGLLRAARSPSNSWGTLSCPAIEAEPVELLLTYVPGGTLAEYLDDLMRANQMRIFHGPPPTAMRTGQNKDKYERLPYTGATLMSEPELRALAIALLQVVKVMHARGYWHCDIKPANVLVDHAPDGSKVFRVCDMGIASKADKSGRLLQCPGGTPAFAAGEVLQKIRLGKSQYPVCLQSDMAAIGMVMAHAAAFRGLPGGLQQYALWARDLPHRTPPALKDFIEQLMSVDPAERLTPDQALAHPWLQ